MSFMFNPCRPCCTQNADCYCNDIATCTHCPSGNIAAPYKWEITNLGTFMGTDNVFFPQPSGGWSFYQGVGQYRRNCNWYAEASYNTGLGFRSVNANLNVHPNSTRIKFEFYTTTSQSFVAPTYAGEAEYEAPNNCAASSTFSLVNSTGILNPPTSLWVVPRGSGSFSFPQVSQCVLSTWPDTRTLLTYNSATARLEGWVTASPRYGQTKRYFIEFGCASTIDGELGSGIQAAAGFISPDYWTPSRLRTARRTYRVYDMSVSGEACNRQRSFLQLEQACSNQPEEFLYCYPFKASTFTAPVIPTGCNTFFSNCFGGGATPWSSPASIVPNDVYVPGNTYCTGCACDVLPIGFKFAYPRYLGMFFPVESGNIHEGTLLSAGTIIEYDSMGPFNDDAYVHPHKDGEWQSVDYDSVGLYRFYNLKFASGVWDLCIKGFVHWFYPPASPRFAGAFANNGSAINNAAFPYPSSIVPRVEAHYTCPANEFDCRTSNKFTLSSIVANNSGIVPGFIGQPFDWIGVLSCSGEHFPAPFNHHQITRRVYPLPTGHEIYVRPAFNFMCAKSLCNSAAYCEYPPKGGLTATIQSSNTHLNGMSFQIPLITGLSTAPPGLWTNNYHFGTNNPFGREYDLFLQMGCSVSGFAMINSEITGNTSGCIGNVPGFGGFLTFTPPAPVYPHWYMELHKHQGFTQVCSPFFAAFSGVVKPKELWARYGDLASGNASYGCQDLCSCQGEDFAGEQVLIYVTE